MCFKTPTPDSKSNSDHVVMAILDWKKRTKGGNSKNIILFAIKSTLNKLVSNAKWMKKMLTNVGDQGGVGRGRRGWRHR